MGTLSKQMAIKRPLTAVPFVLFASVAIAQGGDTGVDLNKGARLSPGETSSQSRELVSKMKTTQKRIQVLYDRARKQKDVIKLNCVTDKLERVRAHMAVVDQSLAALDTAISRGDDGERQHEFRRISIVYEKVSVLGTEAENCIGEDVSYVGDTKVEVEIDPNIPDDDPTQPSLPIPDVTRPPEASPFV
jgi:hypothetical protein